MARSRREWEESEPERRAGRALMEERVVAFAREMTPQEQAVCATRIRLQTQGLDSSAVSVAAALSLPEDTVTNVLSDLQRRARKAGLDDF